VERWRHADDDQNRTETIAELVDMLQHIVRKSKKAGFSLAPFIGVGCPGRVRPDGTIDRGAQNLPGKWEGDSFNLPKLLKEQVPVLKGQDTIVVMHNDAVVQGLSQIPSMRKFEHWGILTIGTGLGNAKFTTVEAGKGVPQRKR
jgi:predicted NBD/HSP70 family sugar kinase